LPFVKALNAIVFPVVPRRAPAGTAYALPLLTRGRPAPRRWVESGLPLFKGGAQYADGTRRSVLVASEAVNPRAVFLDARSESATTGNTAATILPYYFM
jgi:hypothetical protein